MPKSTAMTWWNEEDTSCGKSSCFVAEKKREKKTFMIAQEVKNALQDGGVRGSLSTIKKVLHGHQIRGFIPGCKQAPDKHKNKREAAVKKIHGKLFCKELKQQLGECNY